MAIYGTPCGLCVFEYYSWLSWISLLLSHPKPEKKRKRCLLDGEKKTKQIKAKSQPIYVCFLRRPSRKEEAIAYIDIVLWDFQKFHKRIGGLSFLFLNFPFVFWMYSTLPSYLRSQKTTKTNLNAAKEIQIKKRSQRMDDMVILNLSHPIIIQLSLSFPLFPSFFFSLNPLSIVLFLGLSRGS